MFVWNNDQKSLYAFLFPVIIFCRIVFVVFGLNPKPVILNLQQDSYGLQALTVLFKEGSLYVHKCLLFPLEEKATHFQCNFVSVDCCLCCPVAYPRYLDKCLTCKLSISISQINKLSPKMFPFETSISSQKCF